MERYTQDIEKKMIKLKLSLNEKDKRRYAAIESIKLGHGGIEYISEIFNVDAKTIRKGIKELENNIFTDEKGIRKTGGGRPLKKKNIPT